MKREEILNCILHPDRLKEIPFDRLKQALTDYPYSQNLHFLLAQKSMQEEHPDFERHLKTAATYMNSRSFLRKQLQGNNRPSQPTLEPEPEAEPAQGNPTLNVTSDIVLAELPEEKLPPVTFIPDTPDDPEIPNHVADIATDTPPADQPPPTETSDQNEEIVAALPLIPTIIPSTNQTDDAEIAPTEKKIASVDEPITDQPRIIHERIIRQVEPEASITPGDNVPDLEMDEMDEISGMDLELEEESIQVLATPSPDEAPEIIEFPKNLDVDEEMDDLLNEPLIEVLPEVYGKKQEAEEEPLEEEEGQDELADLLTEEFDDVIIADDLDPEPTPEESIVIQPELGKWIKKYQSSNKKEQKKPKNKKKAKKKKKEEVKKEKTKTKNLKAKKKTDAGEVSSKVDPEGKKTEKVGKALKAKKKVDKTPKKKKKVVEDKLSKKRAIRKFANRSIVEDGETISMTLADLYVKQGKIEKAIVAYERLSLIIPEKKAFFASLIKKLKKK